ncbi:hypothetical protein PAESOLCIP111_02880 [Paenibacillus solanacearum]|uniref:Uncharacterized protein n=1 Tax=Paenibacillus solanacearum TaxID=2048548 RepID=A0A916NJH0_9BACL|nr:hypothetical protein [Paenibacillus solanacearum]CAG7627089.1 hypothetical protein PAESOLCIP111_02880 [Paenibacillus solanacearum]
MNEARAIQWLGLICLLAGLCRMGMTPSSMIWGTDSLPELVFGFVASILMSIGTIAVFMVQSRETGIVGFITILALIIGNIATACMLWTMLQSADPALHPGGVAPAFMRMLVLIGLTGGTPVFTFLSYRANVFPRWVIALLVMMLLSMALPVEDNKYIAFFWGLAYVGMGYTIWGGRLNLSKS